MELHDLTGRRVLSVCAIGKEYAQRIGAQWNDSDVGRELRARGWRLLVFSTDPIQGDSLVWVDPTKLVADQDWNPILCERHDMLARLCKIHLINLVPAALVSISIDADLEWAPDLAPRLESLYHTVRRFGVVVTIYPWAAWGGSQRNVDKDPTSWHGEPVSGAQRADYAGRDGAIDLSPCYMLGVLGRDHSSPRAIALNDAWIEEFRKFPSREQTTFAAAVYRTGIAPLACPMTLLGFPATARTIYGRTPMFRHDPVSPWNGGNAPS